MRNMKLQLLELFSCWQVIEKISQFEIEAQFAIRLNRFLIAARQEHSLIENQRVSLVKRFGTLVDSAFIVEKENEPEFWNEFNKVLNQTIEIYNPMLKPDNFGSNKISAIDLNSIQWLFIPDEDENEV